MNLDLRLPLGLMLSITGIILLSFGLATRARPELFSRSFGINADQWWGWVVFLVGLIVVGIGRRGQGRIELRKQGQTAAGRAKKR